MAESYTAKIDRWYRQAEEEANRKWEEIAAHWRAHPPITEDTAMALYEIIQAKLREAYVQGHAAGRKEIGK